MTDISHIVYGSVWRLEIELLTQNRQNVQKLSLIWKMLTGLISPNVFQIFFVYIGNLGAFREISL